MVSKMPTRELSVMEVVRASFRFYISKLGHLLPSFLIVNIVSRGLWRLSDNMLPTLILPTNLTEEFLYWLINYLAYSIPVRAGLCIVIWLLNVFSFGIAAKYLSDAIQGRRTSLIETFQSVFSALPSLLVSGFISGLLAILGYTLLIIPGIIITIIFSLSVQLITIESQGALESLRTSRRLVAGRWWRTFNILLFAVMICFVVGRIGEHMGERASGSGSDLGWAIAGIIGSIAQPILPVTMTYHYYSLRAKRELVESEPPLQSKISVSQTEIPLPMSVVRKYQPKFCYKCGQRFPSDAVFCPRCGTQRET